jgi:hypothetical protein
MAKLNEEENAGYERGILQWYGNPEKTNQNSGNTKLSKLNESWQVESLTNRLDQV